MFSVGLGIRYAAAAFLRCVCSRFALFVVGGRRANNPPFLKLARVGDLKNSPLFFLLSLTQLGNPIYQMYPISSCWYSIKLTFAMNYDR